MAKLLKKVSKPYTTEEAVSKYWYIQSHWNGADRDPPNTLKAISFGEASKTLNMIIRNQKLSRPLRTKAGTLLNEIVTNVPAKKTNHSLNLEEKVIAYVPKR